MTRLFGLAALVGTLLLAQLAFAWHGVDHLADLDGGNDKVCLECLALVNATPSPPVTTMAVAAMAVSPPPFARLAPPRAARSHRTYFLSRAPPFFPS